MAFPKFRIVHETHEDRVYEHPQGRIIHEIRIERTYEEVPEEEAAYCTECGVVIFRSGKVRPCPICKTVDGMRDVDGAS